MSDKELETEVEGFIVGNKSGEYLYEDSELGPGLISGLEYANIDGCKENLLSNVVKLKDMLSKREVREQDYELYLYRVKLLVTSRGALIIDGKCKAPKKNTPFEFDTPVTVKWATNDDGWEYENGHVRGHYIDSSGVFYYMVMINEEIREVPRYQVLNRR